MNPDTQFSTPGPIQTPQTPPQAPNTSDSYPGKTMGLVSFLLNFVGLGLVSVILGAIALKRSKQAGRKNIFALIGVIVGSIEIVVGIIFALFIAMYAITFIQTCNEYGSGTHVLTSGTSITCNL